MQFWSGHSLSDRYNSRGTQEEDLVELSRKLKFPMEDILRAVQEVGCDHEAVEEYIRDRHNRS